MLTKTSLTIRLHPDDDVVIARQQLVSGTALLDENVKVSGLIPPGHKVATRALVVGAPVKRYNQIIGFAKRAIAAGEHVHLHNLAMGEFARDYAFGADAKPTRYVDTPATFQGIVRADGRQRLRDGRQRRKHARATPYVRRLRAARELRRCADRRPGVRSQPDQ